VRAAGWAQSGGARAQFLGACITPGMTMLVTEVMEGGSLHSRLRSGAITWMRGRAPRAPRPALRAAGMPPRTQRRGCPASAAAPHDWLALTASRNVFWKWHSTSRRRSPVAFWLACVETLQRGCQRSASTLRASARGDNAWVEPAAAGLLRHGRRA